MPATADIIVMFVNVPAQHRPAIELAASIWETQITSSVPIHATVTWTALPAPALARTRTAVHMKDAGLDAGLPVAGVRYPAALAHAIRGYRTGSLADMEIEVSSAVTKWYSGLIGEPDAEEFDLATVVSHEMAHGLGITSQLAAGTQVPALWATIYDTFVSLRDGTKLYQLNASAFNAALADGELRFTGPSTMVAAGGVGPRLHAPSPPETANPTLSHLHEWYLDTDSNALMAPWIAAGWAIHPPGPIVLAILKDIGWTISRLGQATRLRIVSGVPSFVDVGAAMMPVRIEVQDPVGVFVSSGPPVSVALLAVGKSLDPLASWACDGTQMRSTSGGKAVYENCAFDGPGYAWFVVQTEGLMLGSTHVFRIANITTARAPAIARAP